MKQTGVALGIKRAVDLGLAGAALLVLSPVMALASIAILVTMGRPAFFRHTRPGRRGAPFTLTKFRTMRNNPAAIGDPEQDALRLTRLGRILRASSVDELPQLFNVLGGSMSLVGPRPLMMVYLDRYTPEQRRRHDVLPGITGWAQINGRNATSWEDRFQHDLWDVDHWSPWLDVKIIALTIRTVIHREGVAQPGHATMPEFLGTQARS
jgi:sugar transferase EpsL